MSTDRRFRPGRRRWVLPSLLLAAVMLGLQVAHFANPGSLPLITRMNNALYDVRFTLLPPQREPMVPIVIVDIDEFSLQREGRWPWDRKKVAQLVLALRHFGVGLIGLDIVFAEPSRNEVKQILNKADLSRQLRKQLAPLVDRFDSDKALAKVIGANTVLGYFFHNGGASSGQLPFAFYLLSGEQLQRNSLLAMESYTGNIPLLARHALGQGFVVTVPDIDGVVRRVPLIIRHGNGVYASLALTLARIALGAPWIKLQLVDNGNRYVATGVNIGNRVVVPLSANGTMLVPYRGYAGSFPTISATRVLRGDLSPAQQHTLKHSIVLVGASALGLSDLVTTPLQTAYPGVAVHANVLDAILQAALGEQTFYRQPAWAQAAAVVLLLLIGLVTAWSLPGRSPLWMLSIAFLWLLAVVGLDAGLWQFLHLALPLAMPLLLVVLMSALNLAAGFLEASRDKRAVQGLFGEYVPPAYIEHMLAQPGRITMAGEQREMTILFADVAGFTTLSESLTTAELKQLLNRYLTAITDVIFNHRGTIDKYVGDMVIAFWNAPLDDTQHARNGALTALAIQERAAALREEFVKEGLPPLAVGIGLNTGPMNVGDMGSSYRRAYTVLGDAVNLGSRLEGLTRFYGVDVLVSDDTRQQCEDVLFRSVDRIRVKGKHEPVDVFEPLCRLADADGPLCDRVERFEKALAAYRARRFDEARELITALLAEDADRETLYRCYLERIAGFEAESPSDDWQGVFTHTRK